MDRGIDVVRMMKGTTIESMARKTTIIYGKTQLSMPSVWW